MTRFTPGLIVTLLLLSPLPAAANFRLFGRSPTTTVAYYAVPTVYVAVAAPVYAMPACIPTAAVVAPFAPAPGVQTYATPTPAPPSTSREPPLAQPGPLPGVREQQSRYYDVFNVVSAEATRPAGDRCSVNFWNLSNQDLVLTVAGQRISVPRGRNVQLDLERQFAWQVEGREFQTERVPANEPGLEIVIRR